MDIDQKIKKTEEDINKIRQTLEQGKVTLERLLGRLFTLRELKEEGKDDEQIPE